MKNIKVAIAGNPNSGKTTLFNTIAGTNYHVGNYPGVTVEKKEAQIKYNGYKIIFVDLPGTYSLSTSSLEEIVARDYLTSQKPDLVLQVVDALNLERSLYLTTQFLELGLNVILALNMIDIAENREITIDDKVLAKNLNLPVVRTIAKNGFGKKNILDEIINKFTNSKIINPIIINYGNDISPLLDKMEKSIILNNFLTDKYPPRFIALKYIEGDSKILSEGIKHNLHVELLADIKILEKHLKTTFDTYPESIITDYKYGFLHSLLKNVITYKEDPLEKVFLSEKIDKVLTNRLVGPIIMLLIIYSVYQFTFSVSEYPITLIESCFSWLSYFIGSVLPDGLLKSLIISGIIDGVGGVIGFAPLIFLMFATIAVLEDTGYMARIAYMLDRVFKIFGLQGCSVVSFIISGGIAGGCAVPGIMATRTIRGQKERILTILTAPFMMCGAKIPIFALLISAFYPGNKGLAMMMITLVSWLSALIIAKILSKTIVKGESSAFIMELPPYHLPTFKGIFLHAWERTWLYVKKAGTIILGISIVLWILMTFPRLPESRTDNDYKNRSEIENHNVQSYIGTQHTSESLKHSFAGKIGVFFEPATKFAGFDWRINIALLGGFAAKEVVVSTLGTVYSLGKVDPEDTNSLAKRLAADSTWSKATALALIFFTILYAPCLVAIITIVKESGSVKWGAFTMMAYTLIAYITSVLVYQIAI